MRKHFRRTSFSNLILIYKKKRKTKMIVGIFHNVSKEDAQVKNNRDRVYLRGVFRITYFHKSFVVH